MNWLLIALCLATVPPQQAKPYAQSVKRVKQDRAAEVAVPPPPGAPPSVQIPITGSATDSEGRRYTFNGTVTLTLEDPPPPPVPVIVGTRLAGGTQFISETISGTALELVGAGLPTTGQLRLTVGDKTAVVRSWTPTLVQFTAPAVTVPFTGPTKVWQQISNTWTLIAQGPSLTLKPGVAEVPVLPRVDRFLAADGTTPNAVTINQPIVIQGSGFGAEKGRVLVNWAEVPVTLWTDTKIVTTAGDRITGRDPAGKPFASYWSIKIVSGSFGFPQPQGWCGANGPAVIMP